MQKNIINPNLEKVQKFKVLTVVAVMALISSGMLSASQKKNILQNEKESVLLKQQRSMTYLMIITDEERQFLGKAISVHKFNEQSFIKQVKMQPDCFFIVGVNTDATLQTGKLSPNTTHVDWYNRLHKYYGIANRTIVPDNPTSLIHGYITLADEKSVNTMIRILKNERYDCAVCCDSKTGKLTICWGERNK